MNRPEKDFSPVDYKGGCMSINEPWISEAGKILRQEILKRDLKPEICKQALLIILILINSVSGKMKSALNARTCPCVSEDANIWHYYGTEK